jgi:hypothetical protein
MSWETGVLEAVRDQTGTDFCDEGQTNLGEMHLGLYER